MIKIISLCAFAVVIAVTAATSCSVLPKGSHSGILHQLTLTAHCKTQGRGLWERPDNSQACTPGEWIDKNPSRDVVCARSYNPRPGTSITGPLKHDAATLYGLASIRHREGDHLFPVKLGGATTLANFWDEPNYAHKQGAYYWNPKDKLEILIIKRVCDSGKMSVAQGRAVFESGNWVTQYHKYVNK